MTNGIICSNCSTVNDDDAFFCKKCANPLEVKICLNCQTRNPVKSITCLSCKKPLNS